LYRGGTGGGHPRRIEEETLPRTKTRAFTELLIDCEEEWTLRAVLVGMLRETDGG
jgi:hypothetical protein